MLYLAPTKALARDQLAAVAALADPSVRPAAYDGDTPAEERDWVRRHSRWIVTNPDMLHRGILPAHQKWSSTLRRVAYVVIDECHAYRGVFGSHVGHVLRRLRRICRRYGAEPVFVLASATVADPAAAASRLVGAPVVAVTDDGSPRPGATFALWEPPLTERTGEHGAPLRRSAAADAAGLLADLVERGARTLAFVRSRRSAESVADQARRMLHDRGRADLVRRVDSYRGGYLPEERRELERALSSGDLLGVATTNALELGIDIAGLDAVVLAGYPGHARLALAAGRAGRARPAGVAGRVRRPRRPAGPLPGPPPARGLRPADRGHRHRPDQPLRPGAAAVLRGRRAAAAPGGPRRVRRPGAEAQLERAGRRRTAPPAARRLVLGRPGPARRRHPRQRRRTGRRSSRPGPAGCWAPSTAGPPTPPCTPAPCTCTAARRSWSTSSTSRTPAPSCTPTAPSGRRSPATSPTSAIVSTDRDAAARAPSPRTPAWST